MVCWHGMFKENLYVITVRAVRSKASTVYHQTSSAFPRSETAYTPTDVTGHSSRASACSISPTIDPWSLVEGNGQIFRRHKKAEMFVDRFRES